MKCNRCYCIVTPLLCPLRAVPCRRRFQLFLTCNKVRDFNMQVLESADASLLALADRKLMLLNCDDDSPFASLPLCTISIEAYYCH